ncbi:hypothetical protein [Malikia granosa]|uniref:hypothetical protein n=1 Tax=Malikia granosa TaxID=263067 RepID=UPI0011B0B15C|nr:hypothetical protein [Malikia granosa]
MGISDEIERIAEEFIPVCVLIDALLNQEGITPYRLSRWIERNMNAIKCIPVLDFSYDEKDFVWREDIRDAVGDFGFCVNSADGDFDYSLFASYEYDGFVPGWLASDLRGFFSKTLVKYPEKEIDELLKAEHWRIAIKANIEERQAELEQRKALARPQIATAAPQDDEEKPLSTKERNTLLRLVIGVAVHAYGYNPSYRRNTAPGEISEALTELGMSIDPDTVRKYLKEAAETVLPAGSIKP